MWPADTTAAEGSSGVSDAIFANTYSIGYIDSGHGREVVKLLRPSSRPTTKDESPLPPPRVCTSIHPEGTRKVMLQHRFETLLHGHALDMDEIALKNTAGKNLTSKDADISASVRFDPPAHDESWANVSLMNQPGDTTWPLVGRCRLTL